MLEYRASRELERFRSGLARIELHAPLNASSGLHVQLPDYVAAAVAYARDFGFAAVEPTPAAQQNYANFRPRGTADFRRRITRFTPRDHLVQRPVRASAAVSAAGLPATGSC